MANKVFVCGMDTSTLPKLSNAQNMKLLLEVRANTPGAKQEFIYNNMRLVLSMVQRFRIPTEQIDDVFQVGVIGLIKAMNGFNTNLNVQFSTYAVPMILGEIKRYMRDRTSVRVSRSLRDMAYLALKAKEEILREGKDATSEEIAGKVGVSVNCVEDAFNAISDPVSLFDTIFEGKDGSILLIEQLEDKCKREDCWIEYTELAGALKTLSKRERFVLDLRYFQGKTQMEISEEIGISQAQVSRLEKTALQTLKKQL